VAGFEYYFPQRHKMHKEFSIGSKPFMLPVCRQAGVFAGHFYFAGIDTLPK
jgi:hypothetical protein